jgi:hypothetical protein
MQSLTKRLGRAAGLELRLTAFCLRRGVTYTLATKTSDENRRFLMGHKTASRIYSEYASKIATVDLGAFFRNQEPRSLGPMIGMSLNRRDDAPQSISDAGLARCRQGPEFVELYREYVCLRDALIALTEQLQLLCVPQIPTLAHFNWHSVAKPISSSLFASSSTEKSTASSFRKVSLYYDPNRQCRFQQLQSLHVQLPPPPQRPRTMSHLFPPPLQHHQTSRPIGCYQTLQAATAPFATWSRTKTGT